ncbi:TonB-dependent receptor [Helicobacter mesocricetorum]|uniref:TonB-dependent receptor n=1 Tax=Helicobacter mesocricetorum TaxID=87012 RepID=UPI000CF05A08|nr:TonB-dependent receptor [Helicobacter mesocricetorum]
MDYKIGKHYNVWISNAFIGSQRDSSQNKINAYNLTDIGINARFGEFSLDVGVRNLFDKFYYRLYNRD